MSISYTQNSADTHNRNSLKSLVPCFIEDILQAAAYTRGSMTQKELGQELAQKYGVVIGRQALGRHVNTMLAEEEVFHIYGSAGEGYCYSDRYGKYRCFAPEEDWEMEDDEAEGCRLNDRQSLLCAFARSILMNSSNYRKPLSQQKLVDRLENWPYELTVDRRSLSRTLETMMDVYPEICRCSEGYYFDRLRAAA